MKFTLCQRKTWDVRTRAVAFLLGVAWPIISPGTLESQSRSLERAEQIMSPFPMGPLAVGMAIESAYDALGVPPTLASEPCFVNEGDMTARCYLTTSRYYSRGTRLVSENALPIPADSVELRVLTESRRVVGYTTYVSSPTDAAFDSVSLNVRRYLESVWGTSDNTLESCLLWRPDSPPDEEVWVATFCDFKEGRWLYVHVAPANAEAARAHFAGFGARGPRSVSRDVLGHGEERKIWLPAWRPYAINHLLEPGGDVGALVREAGVRVDARSCERSTPVAGLAHFNCEWRSPRLSVFGFEPTALSIQAVQESDWATASVTAVRLVFGNYTESRAVVAGKCRVVVAALSERWGLPTEGMSNSDECGATWKRFPFIAEVGGIHDDARPGPDVWSLWVSTDLLLTTAMPPEWWRRW